jgi:DNA-binding CsgD family transcriptional regulator
VTVLPRPGAGHFVGRAEELGTLRGTLEAAFGGRGGLVFLSGEAGIGKTRVARELAAEAAERGAIVLWGSCYEGEWQPPYGPWVEALGALVRSVEPARLRRELGAGAAPLTPLLPAVRAALPDTPAPAPLGPDEERFRLYEAVVQWLLAASGERPVVLILDDLHWADTDSLGLLRQVARFTGRARLLLLAIYRDPDPDFGRGTEGSRPGLPDTLAMLRREVDYQRIAVGGLSFAEVATYLAESAEAHFPEALARAIYAETDGSPFYTKEVFQHLVEEGKIFRRGDRWSTDFSLGDLGIPDGVRQVLGHRFARLSAAANELLRYAAAFSGGFELRVLGALTELPEDAILDAIDETLRAGLMRVLPGRRPSYDFTHAIIRHTLYDAQNPDRRARLHRRIAERLERLYDTGAASQPSGHAAELAAQYHASSALPGAERGIGYALTAAEQARTGYASERAVAFLRIARDLAAAAPVAERAGIAMRLALAEAEALFLEAARRSGEEAAQLLATAGAPALETTEFLATLARLLKDGGAGRDLWDPLVARGLALLPDPEAVATDGERLAWARLTLLRDRLEVVARGTIYVDRWLGYDPRAIALARTLGDEADYARTLEPLDWRSPAETQAVLRRARTWQPPAALIRGLEVVLRDLIYNQGNYREAADVARELLATSERFGSLPGQAEALAQLAMAEAVLGDPAGGQATADRALELVARLGSEHRLQVVIRLAIRSVLAYFLGGDWTAMAALASTFVATAGENTARIGLIAAAFAAFDHGWAGNSGEALRMLRALVPAFAATPPTVYNRSGGITMAVVAVWNLGVVELAASYRRFAREALAAGAGPGPMGSLAPAVARMAALLGDAAEAREYFARGRAEYAEKGQSTFGAITLCDEAEAILRFAAGPTGGAERARAAVLLDEALAAFGALGMEFWAQRARALQTQLGSPAAPRSAGRAAYPDGLTVREVEVLRLIAGGRTNKEIAEILVLSVPTVQRHITNLYGKIGARGRADATAYSLRHDLGREEKS